MIYTNFTGGPAYWKITKKNKQKIVAQEIIVGGTIDDDNDDEMFNMKFNKNKNKNKLEKKNQNNIRFIL